MGWGIGLSVIMQDGSYHVVHPEIAHSTLGVLPPVETKNRWKRGRIKRVCTRGGVLATILLNHSRRSAEAMMFFCPDWPLRARDVPLFLYEDLLAQLPHLQAGRLSNSDTAPIMPDKLPLEPLTYNIVPTPQGKVEPAHLRHPGEREQADVDHSHRPRLVRARALPVDHQLELVQGHLGKFPQGSVLGGP